MNYYWRSGFSPSTRTSALLSLQMLKDNDAVGTIILVDGSPHLDPFIKQNCEELGIQHLHSGKELTFSQGYNLGWQTLKEQYVGLMASDIFPPKTTIATLLKWLERPDVGCAFPYLTYCDYPGQMAGYVRRRVTCEPSAMTLNLNVFKRDVLEAVGGIDEHYSGGYNDLILLMKIRELGFRVLLAGETRVNHLGQMTISQGTTYKKDADIKRFSTEYRTFCAGHGKWKVKHWRRPLSCGPLLSVMWWLSQNAPHALLRRPLERFTMTREPELAKYPARWGRKQQIAGGRDTTVA